MSKHPKDSEFGPPPKQRHLVPVARRIELHGGGSIEVSYRLTKGSHLSRDSSACIYGLNPETREVESYFSTEDTAALEITLRNESALHLKHVHLAHLRLSRHKAEPAAPERLPDGNLVFEVMPDAAYVGHLGKSESVTKYLGLVTRGVAAGHYHVSFDVEYEIVDGRAEVSLPLTVNPE